MNSKGQKSKDRSEGGRWVFGRVSYRRGVWVPLVAERAAAEQWGRSVRAFYTSDILFTTAVVPESYSSPLRLLLYFYYHSRESRDVFKIRLFFSPLINTATTAIPRWIARCAISFRSFIPLLCSHDEGEKYEQIFTEENIAGARLRASSEYVLIRHRTWVYNRFIKYWEKKINVIRLFAGQSLLFYDIKCFISSKVG